MAKGVIALGAEVDIASSAEVAAVGASLGDKLDSLLGRDPRPIYDDIAKAGQPATGFQCLINLGGPASGRVWDLRQLVLTGGDDSNAYSVVTAVAAGGAAAGSVASLPAGVAITGFDVEFATTAAPVSGDVTVTGVAGGTLTFKITDGLAGGALNIRFPVPIPPAVLATPITVTVPAIVGSGAHTTVAYGTVQAAWYKVHSDAPSVLQLLTPRGGGSGAAGGVPSSIVPASSESIFLHFGESLVAAVYGLTTGQSVVAIARVAEWPDGATEARRL